MSNYKSALKRINGARSMVALRRVWVGIVSVHGVGHLSDYHLICLGRKRLIKAKRENWGGKI